VASAFVAPAALRSLAPQSDASSRQSYPIGHRAAVSMTSGGGGGGGREGGGESQSRRDVIAGENLKGDGAHESFGVKVQCCVALLMF